MCDRRPSHYDNISRKSGLQNSVSTIIHNYEYLANVNASTLEGFDAFSWN